MLNVDLVKEFIFDCRMTRYSERTIKGYLNNNLGLFKFISNEYGIVDVEETNHIAIRGYVEFLTNKGLKETYINGLIKCFRSYFAYCVREEYILHNPAQKIRFQKEPIIMINTFINEEVKRMVNYFNGSSFLDIRNKLIMVILCDTGIRNYELCNLKLSDIRETYINIMGKGKKVRHVPITAIINKHLIKYMRVRENYIKDKINYDEEFLLLSRTGRQLTIGTLENVVEACGEACNIRREIRISPHTCRHYYAQAQLKNGCDLFTVSRLLGHSNINITKRYLQSMQDSDILEMGAKTSPLMNL
jgi:integrase/recombinase XerD